MKIALLQMDVIPGNPEVNFNTLKKMIQQAKDNLADVVVASELCISGYLLGDKWTETSYCEWMENYNDKMKELSDGIVLIYGNVKLDKDEKNQDGRVRKYNGAYIYQNKQKVSSSTFAKEDGFQPKTLLPNYRFFDDERYFSSLSDDVDYHTYPFLVEIKGKKYALGLEICEDLWCKDYNTNPTRELILNGANIIINISASPWTYGKNNARDNAIKHIYDDLRNDNINGVPFCYVNNIGVQNNGKNFITFDGGTSVYDNDGKLKATAHRYYEDIVYIYHNEKNETNIEDMPTIERKESSKIEDKYIAIINALSTFNKNQKWVIGISGGIDSALAAYMLVQVFGANNVTGINMPTKFNSNKTRDTAKQIAKNLGINYIEVPIEGIVNENINILTNFYNKEDIKELTIENIQARIRSSNVLSSFAAHLGALYTNNGNKLESSLGYCTAYGDMNGAIALFGDLLKVEIFELAKYINETSDFSEEPMIPEVLFPDEMYRFGEDKIASGPELKANHVSALKIGYHDYLIAAFTDYRKVSPDEILQWYFDGVIEDKLALYGMRKGMMARYGMDNKEEFLKDLEWVCKQFHYAIWKRIQTCPIIVLSKTSFGYDLRESQLPFIKTGKYIELEEKIRNKA